MSKPFAVVTDTGHNIPPDIVRDLQLQEVPFTINFGVQGSVDDGVLELGEFAALLDRYEKGAGYPTTAAPSPGRFADAFRRAIAARVVVLFGRVRGRMDKAIESIVEDVRKTRNLGRISVVEGIAPDLKEALIQRLSRVVNVTREQIEESKIGPSFLIHTGKRAVGVLWEEKG